MAYLASDWNKDEQEDDTQQSQSSEKVLSDTSSTPISEQSASASPASGPKKGTGFVNIGRYLSANEADAPEQTGKVVSGLDNQVGSARNDLKGVQDSFTAAANAQNTKTNDAELQKLYTSPGAVDKNEWSRMNSGQYAGPKELDTAAPLASYNRAKSNIDNTASSSGRFALINDMFGRSNYRPGEARLDQAIMQTDPNSKQALGDVRAKYADVGNELTSAQDQARQTAATRQAEAQKTKEQAKSSTDAALAYWKNNVDNTSLQANMARDAAFQRAISQAKGLPATDPRAGSIPNAPTGGGTPPARYGDTVPLPSPGTVNLSDPSRYKANDIDLGLGEIGDLYGVDPTKYITKGRTLTADDLITAENRSKLTALAELTGGTPMVSRQSSNLVDDAVNFDRDALLAAVAAEKKRKNPQQMAFTSPIEGLNSVPAIAPPPPNVPLAIAGTLALDPKAVPVPEGGIANPTTKADPWANIYTWLQ